MAVLVLDAMGVIYQSGDDVADLLIPYICKRTEEHGSRIKELYHQCSLGLFSSAVFWEQLGLSANVEDDYLSQHQLVSGVKGFLVDARESFDSIWCLSNDVSEWSVKLREKFSLECLFDGFVISGDVKSRKPSPEIYQVLCARSCSSPDEIVFIDDRPGNVVAAIDNGIDSILFGKQAKLFLGLACAHDYLELGSLLLSSHEENDCE